MQDAPPNGLGWTRTISTYVSPGLLDQLVVQHVDHTVRPIDRIAGMGGQAYLVHYTSPRTHRPMTCLVTPERPGIDIFGETVYYFDGVDQDAAYVVDWPERYGLMMDIAAEHRRLPC